MYIGISSLKTDETVYELGDGILVRKSFGHLMAHYMLALRPAPGNQSHPAPWHQAGTHFSSDATAEIYIPEALGTLKERQEILSVIVFLMRIVIDPEIRMLAVSNMPFGPENADLKNREVFAIETAERHFPISIAQDTSLELMSAFWIKMHWKTTLQMQRQNKKFSLACEAFDQGPFLRNTGLTLVSLWGGLEALFSCNQGELRFRLACYLAAYLEPAGQKRFDCKEQISDLYDRRSKAAHGTPKHTSDELISSFVLLRKALIQIITADHIPAQNELEGLLLGTLQVSLPDYKIIPAEKESPGE